MQIFLCIGYFAHHRGSIITFLSLKVALIPSSMTCKAVGKKGLFHLGAGHIVYIHVYHWERELKSFKIFQFHQRVQVSMVVDINNHKSITYIGRLFSNYTLGWDVLHQDLIGINSKIKDRHNITYHPHTSQKESFLFICVKLWY